MMCGSNSKIVSLACTQFMGICWITRNVHIADISSTPSALQTVQPVPRQVILEMFDRNTHRNPE